MEKSSLDIINEIGKYCLSNGFTLSLAESVTSGYLQYLFSQGEDSSLYFQGGITLYNNQQKFKQFGISPLLTQNNNGVSPLVTELLAKGANLNFETDLGIGITGYAYRDLNYNISQPHCYVAMALNNTIIYSTKLEAYADSMPHNQESFASQCVTCIYDNLITLNDLRDEKLFKKQ